MASCKDCIHYDICIFHLKGNENERCLNFIPTADVVPKSEVEELKAIIADHKASEERLEELYSNAKAEVAREIFAEIEKAMSDNFHADCQMGDCIEDYYDCDLADDIANLKKKYTEDITHKGV